jgi:glycosyltransferase involved in cell wall biosynthesis
VEVHVAATRLAVSQRICPEWRVPLFAALNARDDIDLTLYFGRGRPSGAYKNADSVAGFAYRMLPTVDISYGSGDRVKHRVVHPTLMWHLIRGRYGAVLVEPFTNIPNDLATFAYCRLTGARFLWSDVGNPPSPSVPRSVLQRLRRFLIRRADACVALNSAARRDLIDDGCDPRKVFLAQNSIDIEGVRAAARSQREHVADLRTQLELSPDEHVFLFIGAIEHRKRVENLIRAVVLLRSQGLPARAVIVGDGSDEGAVKKALSADETAATLFVGRHEEDAPAYILMAESVVLPGEGGLAINHAFACGRPCVATREAVAGGDTVLDYISDGHNGFIVDVNDVPALSDALRMIAVDRDLWKALSAAAWKTGDRLTVEMMARGIARAVAFAVHDA